jgi:uncharacterized membrane protein YdjX (TVP38/TMEM64 family)
MRKFIGILLLLIAFFIALWLFRESITDAFSWFGSREAVAASMGRAGIWAPVILFILFVLQVFLAFIPGQALMVACGYLYGFWGGFLLSWLSLVTGGEAAYLLASRYGRPFAEKWVSPGILTRWNKIAKGQGIAFYAISLVMPFVPNDAMCYVAGLGRISHRHFSIANLIGRGMACVITSWIGAFGLQAPTHVWIIVTILALLALLTWQLARRFQGNSYAL